MDRILSVYGISQNNLLGIIKLSFVLSLNDSYWCVPEGFNGRFKDRNLYGNEFDKDLALIAFTGVGRCCPVMLKTCWNMTCLLEEGAESTRITKIQQLALPFFFQDTNKRFFC